MREATVHPRATENIDEILSIIGALVDKGFAYPSGGDVYFRTRKDPGYGKLSHQPIEDLESGARIEVGDAKAVSYTHLDVYKRQVPWDPMSCDTNSKTVRV